MILLLQLHTCLVRLPNDISPVRLSIQMVSSTGHRAQKISILM